MSPDMRRKVDASRTQRMAAENAVQKQMAQQQASFSFYFVVSLVYPRVLLSSRGARLRPVFLRKDRYRWQPALSQLSHQCFFFNTPVLTY